jgi:hypothetical protein
LRSRVSLRLFWRELHGTERDQGEEKPDEDGELVYSTSTSGSAAPGVFDGARPDERRLCGAEVWYNRLTYAAALQLARFDRNNRLITWALLEPRQGEGIGAAHLTPAGVVLTGQHGTGDLNLHRCPAITITCHTCSAPIRVLTLRRRVGFHYDPRRP